ACLMEYAKKPVTADGKRSSPVCYDSACLEEVCGSCAMRINGVSRMGCTALVDTLEQPIVIEPLAKFPVVRDLSVDRSRMFGALMGEGGINDCGNAQNCVRACPKSIPLTTSIAAMYRATTVQAIKDVFGRR